MPELPEVETVRLQLKRKIVGKTIAAVKVFNPKTVGSDEKIAKRLKGGVVADIARIGKLLIFSFENKKDLFVLAHLKMTGQFFYIDKKGASIGGGHSQGKTEDSFPNRHTRVSLNFTDGTSLHFNDMRMFGYFKTATTEEVAAAKARFGPEPISSDFDPVWFYEKLKKRKAPIKAALLDQTFIAGLGNIYVDEALWAAKVAPTRRADLVTKKEAAAIAAAAGAIMNESITYGGTTFQNFKDTGGKNGNYLDYLKVFSKQGMPCPRCGTKIIKIRCAGRGTHYCTKCQK